MTDPNDTVAVPVAVLAEWRRVLTAMSYGELEWGEDADEATKVPLHGLRNPELLPAVG